MSFWSARFELCGCCCSAQRVLCDSCPAHQVLVSPFPCCCVSSSCARDCVFLTRDMAGTTAQEISYVHIISHGSGECVYFSLSMEARVIASEEVIAERLARQTAEAAQQTVGPQPAGAGGGGQGPSGLPSLVDTKAIGTPRTFSGDIDENGQPEGMAWSQWSFVFRSYLGAFDPTATRLLRQVETNVEDLVVVDNTSMTEVEKGLSMQLFHVLALTCRGKALQVVRRVPEGFGFEA